MATVKKDLDQGRDYDDAQDMSYDDEQQPDYDEGAQVEYGDDFGEADADDSASQEWFARKQK
ncbi:MAG: hypothetical protein ACRYG7_46315 [Janthinobacterium lividum]